MRILIADDDEYILALLADHLRSLNHEVFECENGQLAIDELKKREFDVVVSDVEMPLVPGPELFTFVKSLDPRPRFIFFSSSLSIVNSSLLVEADAHFRKVEAQELIKWIKNVSADNDG